MVRVLLVFIAALLYSNDCESVVMLASGSGHMRPNSCRRTI